MPGRHGIHSTDKLSSNMYFLTWLDGFLSMGMFDIWWVSLVQRWAHYFPARANLPDILLLSFAKCEDEEPATKAVMIIWAVRKCFSASKSVGNVSGTNYDNSHIFLDNFVVHLHLYVPRAKRDFHASICSLSNTLQDFTWQRFWYWYIIAH